MDAEGFSIFGVVHFLQSFTEVKFNTNDPHVYDVLSTTTTSDKLVDKVPGVVGLVSASGWSVIFDEVYI